MPKKAINVLVDEEVYNKLKEYADNNNVSMRQALEDILRDYFQPKTTHSPKGIVLGKIDDVILNEDSKCALCGRELKKGYHVKFAENLGHICLRCYYRKLYDKGLAEKYLKIKELQETIKQLKKRADELAAEVEKRQLAVNITKIIERLENVITQIENMRTYPALWNEKYDNILDALMEIEETILGLSWVVYHELKRLGIEFDRHEIRRKLYNIQNRIRSGRTY